MKFRAKPASAPSLLIVMMVTLKGQAEVCHRSEYQIGDLCCPACPTGHRVQRDCSEVKSTLCRPCSEGTFINKPTGLRHCFPCRDCDAAAGLRIKTPCTKKSDTVCETLRGFYCGVSAEDGSCAAAQRHRSCRPGQHITHTGTSQRDTECSDCSAGTFSDGTFTTCQPHRQCETENLLKLKPGTHSSDAICGARSSYVTEVSAGVSAAVLFFLVIASLVLFYFLKRIKRRLNRGQKDKSPLAHCEELIEPPQAPCV